MTDDRYQVPSRVERPPSLCSPRAGVLAVLRGERVRPLPVFSGLPSLTASGLRAAGVRYADAHGDATLMARAAASTCELYGFASAVVPFDLCVEAEALGCAVDYHGELDAFLAPVVSQPLAMDARLSLDLDLSRAGRLPLVAEAIRQLHARADAGMVIGACVPGPFTLGWQLFGAEAWLSGIAALDRAPLLGALADLVARVAARYRAAGADFITVHEMGGSPQVIGPLAFRAHVQPALARLFAQLPKPAVLSICGDTNAVIADMAACGANALSVDQRNDLARSRRVLGDAVTLFGNLDPVADIAHGTPERITRAVRDSAAAGASAIWPGCDLCVETPPENLRALIEAAEATM